MSEVPLQDRVIADTDAFENGGRDTRGAWLGLLGVGGTTNYGGGGGV